MLDDQEARIARKLAVTKNLVLERQCVPQDRCHSGGPLFEQAEGIARTSDLDLDASAHRFLPRGYRRPLYKDAHERVNRGGAASTSRGLRSAAHNQQWL